MLWTIITGVLIALMFLVSFSEWFYHLLKGLNEVIVEDIYILYRAGAWGVGAAIVMLTVFWVLSVDHACKMDEAERKGLFAKIDCTVYESLVPAEETIKELL